MAVTAKKDSAVYTENIVLEEFGTAPVSRRIKRRNLVIYTIMLIIGLAPQALQWGAGWKVAGLGLIFPGAGFLAAQGWGLLLFPLTVVLMLLACALWQLMANAAAPLFIWIGGLLLAVAMAPQQVGGGPAYAAGVCVLAFALLVRYASRKTLQEERHRQTGRTAYLPGALAQLKARASRIPLPGARELSPADLAALRYSLDRGLQPVESLHGFDVIEQYQTSAIRYQINFLLWGLQLAQCHYTPNFHGYLSLAQRNLIDKLTVPKVWKWWRWENLLGNFRFNADPIAKDNIMFGGFSSANIAMYTANTGDDRYLQPGSLTFRENDRKSYRHSLATILEAGRFNQDTAVYGPLYPCEPRLTYSTCNVWGHLAHLTGDRLFDSNCREGLVERMKPLHISEMMGLDGSPHSGRVNTLGIRMPIYSCHFVSAQWGWMAAPFFADLAKRTWAVLREEALRFDDNGEASIETKAYDRVDTGNYRKSEAGVYGHFLIFARELGDDEAAQALQRSMDRKLGKVEHGGVISYQDASNVNNAVAVIGRLTRRDDIRRMVLEGPPQGAMKGPLLDCVAYPDVLVSKAFSQGDDLHLVLYPGTENTRQTLQFSRLKPATVYSVNCAGGGFTIEADQQGKAECEVSVSGRTEIMIEPASP